MRTETRWISVLLIAAVNLTSCKFSSNTQNQSDTKALTGEGASNTNGIYATVPLDAMIRFHLKENNIDYDKLTGGKSILVSIDYFFPTNFSELTDEDVSVETAVQHAKTAVSALMGRFDYVLFANLFQGDRLSPDIRKSYDETWNSAWYNGYKLGMSTSFNPLKNIESNLATSPLTKQKVSAVNTMLDELSARSGDKFKLMKIELFASKIILDGGVRDSTSGQLIPLNSIFVSDEIHLNDTGFAAIFNYMIRYRLMALPGLTPASVPEMPIHLDYGAKRKQDIIQFTYADPTKFSTDQPGLYFGAVSKDLALQPDSQQTAGAPVSIENLKAIAKRIESAKYPGLHVGGGHAVGVRKQADGLRVLTLDHSKTIQFNSIDLTETSAGSGEFVGYGFDFFYWASGSPSANYKFVGRRNPQDPQVVTVDWYIFPLLKSAKSSQKRRLVSLKTLDPDWIAVLNGPEAKSMPRLHYQYQVKIAGRP